MADDPIEAAIRDGAIAALRRRAAARRVMADALEIEAGANRRLADEYDAAQERGEVAAHGGDRGNQHVAKIPDQNVATAAQANVSPKEIFEARQIRNAEEREPGIVRRVLDEKLAAGQEPTRAGRKPRPATDRKPRWRTRSLMRSNKSRPNLKWRLAMPTDRIDPPPLAPELADLLQTTERDVLRAIACDGDIIDGFKARLLSAAHGLPDDDDEGDGDAWLLVRLSPALLDALAAFEADDADLEAEPDLEEGGDTEPSLGATNDRNQEKAWRSPTEDLEFDGDGVADADLEPNLGSVGSYSPGSQESWAAGSGPDECEEENEHAESAGFGDGCVDMEPMLGATEDMNQRWAWIKPGWPYCDDGEATETEDDLPQPERPGLTLEQSQAEDAAKRAAVQEALGRLREVTGVRAYAGGGRGVRFYSPDEIKTIDGVRIVGILR